MGTGVQREGVSGGRPGRRGKRKKKRITILERKKKKKLGNNVSNLPHTHTKCHLNNLES